jgi:hypothetical protein
MLGPSLKDVKPDKSVQRCPMKTSHIAKVRSRGQLTLADSSSRLDSDSRMLLRVLLSRAQKYAANRSHQKPSQLTLSY